MLFEVTRADPLCRPMSKGAVAVSYESRKKKRAYKRAEARSRRSPETARRWFLTVAKKPGRFACCGRRFDRGAEVVYRHEPREVRCMRCADRDPDVRYQASMRWERKVAGCRKTETFAHMAKRKGSAGPTL